MLEKSNFKHFGWQGFLLDIPENCRFVAEGGSLKSGFIRFDCEKLQFEIKWESLPKKVDQLPSDVADKLVKKIAKESKVKTLPYRSNSINVNAHRAVSIRLKTNLENRIAVWYCPESERIVVARFLLTKGNDESESIMRSVIDSLKCHGFKEFTWSLLGFKFKMPKPFQLGKRKLVVGRTSLNFSEQKQTFTMSQRSEIIFECFSLANIQFKDSYNKPRQWIQKYYVNELKAKFRRIKFEKYSHHHLQGHQISVCTGKAISGLALRRNTLLIIASWFCPESARTYAFTTAVLIKKIPFTKGIDAEQTKKMFRKILSTVICH